MSDPSETPTHTASASDGGAEHELSPEQSAVFDALHVSLRRSTLFGRVVSGMLVMLALAVVRLQMHVGHPVGHLGVLVIAALVASAVLFTLTFGLARGGRAAAGVARSTGSDVSYVMDTMRGLLSVFLTLFATLVAVAALALVVLAMHFTHHL